MRRVPGRTLQGPKCKPASRKRRTWRLEETLYLHGNRTRGNDVATGSITLECILYVTGPLRVDALFGSVRPLARDRRCIIWLLVYTTCQISSRSTPHSGLGNHPRTHDLRKPGKDNIIICNALRVHETLLVDRPRVIPFQLFFFLSLPTFTFRLSVSLPTPHSRFHKSFTEIMFLLILLISITLIRSTLAATADQWRGRSIYQYCQCC